MAALRIAIDYTSAITERAGIGRYTRGLVAALAQVNTEDHLTLFSSEQPPAAHPPPKAPQLQSRIVPIGHRNLTRLWQTLRIPLPAEFLMGRADLIHGPDFVLPPAALRAKRIVTIHDLAYLTHPDCAQPGIVAFLSAAVPRALRAADHIIAISEYTASGLMDRYDVPRERINVIYPGVDATFTPQRDKQAIQQVMRAYELEQPFILAVSTIEPRKNYTRLIEAFAAATRQSEGPRMLIIAGRKGWLYEDVFATVERYQLASRVRFLDYVPEEQLPALYHAATALAMPSLTEGFGMPVVEAMASGTPVICSTGGALPEVAGDAAMLVAPDDVAALADELARVTADVALREQLIARGLARAQRFQWEAAARAHFAVYHQTASGR